MIRPLRFFRICDKINSPTAFIKFYFTFFFRAVLEERPVFIPTLFHFSKTILFLQIDVSISLKKRKKEKTRADRKSRAAAWCSVETAQWKSATLRMWSVKHVVCLPSVDETSRWRSCNNHRAAAHWPCLARTNVQAFVRLLRVVHAPSSCQRSRHGSCKEKKQCRCAVSGGLQCWMRCWNCSGFRANFNFEMCAQELTYSCIFLDFTMCYTKS